MRANQTLLEALLELQILDRVPRSGWTLRGVPDPESVSEHSFHVLFLVWAIGRQVPGLDRMRALELALVHDLAEVRFGDLPSTASRYLLPPVKHRAEAAALAELLAPLGAEATELYDEYQQGASLEARLVKACDKLQLMLKVAHYERWGAAGLAEFWDNPANFPGADLPEVRAVFEELRELARGRRAEVP